MVFGRKQWSPIQRPDSANNCHQYWRRVWIGCRLLVANTSYISSVLETIIGWNQSCLNRHWSSPKTTTNYIRVINGWHLNQVFFSYLRSLETLRHFTALKSMASQVMDCFQMRRTDQKWVKTRTLGFVSVSIRLSDAQRRRHQLIVGRMDQFWLELKSNVVSLYCSQSWNSSFTWYPRVSWTHSSEQFWSVVRIGKTFQNSL